MRRFRDVEPYTRAGNYAVDIQWAYLPTWLDRNIESNNFNLNPDFQRVHVWTKAQQERYVEHIIRGGVSGKDLYFNHPGWMCGFEGEGVLIDGKQRLEAVLKFLNNKVKAFGCYMKEYDDKPDPLDCAFRVHVNDLQTRAEVLTWYLQINTGGTPHSKTEIARVQALLEAEKEEAAS